MSTFNHTHDSNSAMRLDGGNGNDTLAAAGWADNVYGGDGDDQLSATAGSSTGTHSLYGGTGNDKLLARGGAGADRLYGDDGNDRLSGENGGKDSLHGGNGDDLLITGNGSSYNLDTLTGGAGSDMFAFASNAGTFGQAATVSDFNPLFDVWITNTDFAARFVHSGVSVTDFARVVQVNEDVHVGKTAAGAGTVKIVFKKASVADVIAAFDGAHANFDEHWLEHIGDASSGVSTDAGAWGDGTSSGDGGANADMTVPLGSVPSPNGDGIDPADMDLLDALNSPGLNTRLFDDPLVALAETLALGPNAPPPSDEEFHMLHTDAFL